MDQPSPATGQNIQPDQNHPTPQNAHGEQLDDHAGEVMSDLDLAENNGVEDQEPADPPPAPSPLVTQTQLDQPRLLVSLYGDPQFSPTETQ
ncbi:hypothetical protein FRC11_012036 [Ceratobasidium sp. 423]|nr:hypothetical protein FRC11_012036 [Ceratobasidium sp. 423]